MNSIKMGFLEKFKSPFNLKARPVLFGTKPHPEFLISSRTETSFRSVYLWEGRPQPWINFYIFHIFSAIMTANTRKASGGGKVPKSVCFGCCVDIGKWSLASVWLVGRYDDQSSVACTIKLSIPPIIIHSLQQQRQQTTWVNPDPCCLYVPRFRDQQIWVTRAFVHIPSTTGSSESLVWRLWWFSPSRRLSAHSVTFLHIHLAKLNKCELLNFTN